MSLSEKTERQIAATKGYLVQNGYRNADFADLNAGF